MFYSIFILMLIFMPLFVICVFGNIILNKIKVDKLIIDHTSCTYNPCCRLILFFILLPWNVLAIGLCLAVVLVGGTICMPFFLIQSYVDNTKRFRSYVRYWNGKQRFDTNVKEEKIIFSKPYNSGRNYTPVEDPIWLWNEIERI